MTLELNYKDILARFDDLVTRGIVYYAPPTTVPFEAHGFPIQFHISPSLRTKPQYGESALQKTESFGPGSDIANSDQELLVMVVHDTHLLVVNKFPVFRPQLLLLTQDSYRRQHEPLSLDDFAAACSVLKALECPPHYVIYNCCPAAGASRQHKHLQILPRPAALLPDQPNFNKQAIPYKYFLKYLHNIDLASSEGHRRILDIYRELLVEAKESSKHHYEPHHGNHFPHNVALVGEWLIVIPRRTNDFKGVTANTPGMLGSIWLTSEAQMERWKRVGPTQVLSGLGVPAESQNQGYPVD